MEKSKAQALLEEMLNAKNALSTAKSNLEKAELELKESLKRFENCKLEVLANENLKNVLVNTGIKTLDNNLISVDAGGFIVITPFIQPPAIWELKDA